MPISNAKQQSILNASTQPVSRTKTHTAQGNAQFKNVIYTPAVQQRLIENLGNTVKAKSFTAALVSAVSTNPALAKCDAYTIISAALIGESLGLSPSPQLGQYYVVPYKKRDGSSVATFQLGWRAYLQMAHRTGAYKRIEASVVREGDLISYNPVTNEIVLNDKIEDVPERDKKPVIGYYGMFELINGFKKEIYMPKARMESHATRYSQSYRSDKNNDSSKSLWTTNFDDMALKTIYRQLIGKYGVMSNEMQTAYLNDMTAGAATSESLNTNSERSYIDNDEEMFNSTVDKEPGVASDENQLEDLDY